jgi:hypothetical protein
MDLYQFVTFPKRAERFPKLLDILSPVIKPGDPGFIEFFKVTARADVIGRDSTNVDYIMIAVGGNTRSQRNQGELPR